jgi:short-subunit dehydrogenase
VTGKWAVITGGTSGIGKALAFELASRHYDLFLTGRNIEALREVAAGCERLHAVQTRTHAADLAEPAQTAELTAALNEANLCCEVLVNNAGFGVKGKFAATPLAGELDLTRVQLDAMLMLTKAVLPGMMQRGKGAILNVASVYSFAPVPQQSVYAACKAFLLWFSDALREELRGSGVTVTILCPGVTQTEFRARAGIVEKNAEAGWTAAAVARAGVAGALRGRPLVVPGLVNRLFVTVFRHLPYGLAPWIMNFINNRRGVNR